MKKWIVAILLLGIFSLNCTAPVKPDQLIVAFYNVENLFDTINDPHTFDEEFLPDGKKEWNTVRYKEKLNHLADVIMNIGDGSYVNLMGLCEVENRKVLQDLCNTAQLKGAKYSIIHRESPDFRGIDVALLYQPSVFTPLDSAWYRLFLDGADTSSTREILYVKGLCYGKDTAHVFVNHWPSRIGGQEESEYKRVDASNLLKQAMDSILAVVPDAKIILLGDMNDTPNHISVYSLLQDGNTTRATHAIDAVLNEQSFPGTYNYQDNWDLLDHIIVSKGITEAKKGIRYAHAEAGIFVRDWMLYTNDEGTQYPNRSYGGSNYYGGYSDHFPVYVKLEVK